VSVTLAEEQLVLQLMPDTGDIDSEILALSQNKRFWRMFDAAYQRGEKEGWIEFEDLD
jgi:hypothetical protein